MTTSNIHIRDAESGEMRPLRSDERICIDLREVANGVIGLAACHGLTPAERGAAAHALLALAERAGHELTAHEMCAEVAGALRRIVRAQPAGDTEMRDLQMLPFLKALERLMMQSLRVVQD